MPSPGTTVPKSPCVHQPGNSLTPVLLGLDRGLTSLIWSNKSLAIEPTELSFMPSLLPLTTSHQPPSFSSVSQSCLTFSDPMDCTTPGLPVHHQLLEPTQTHVHQVCDAIQPSHPLSPSSVLNLSQSQGLFQWVSSSHQVVKVLELQFQHQSFQCIYRVDFL